MKEPIDSLQARATPVYQAGNRLTFTNHSSSGYTGNDGKPCTVRNVKPVEDWYTPEEPEYVIDFDDGSNSFGVRESELSPTTQEIRP